MHINSSVEYIKADDIFKYVLSWLNTEEFYKMLSCSEVTPGFTNGAIWGATMAAVIISNNAPRSYLQGGTFYASKESIEPTENPPPAEPESSDTGGVEIDEVTN